MKKTQRIQEAHGLWELAIARLAAMVEADADRARIRIASTDEREAFRNWQRVSKDCGA
jgi:DNA-binding FadR family transcriptional regulator